MKGTNRRVIVVRSPDLQVFEEAIFIVREDLFRNRNAEQVMDEARSAAQDYLKEHVRKEKRKRPNLRRALLCSAGVVVIALAWLTIHFIYVL